MVQVGARIMLVDCVKSVLCVVRQCFVRVLYDESMYDMMCWIGGIYKLLTRNSYIKVIARGGLRELENLEFCVLGTRSVPLNISIVIKFVAEMPYLSPTIYMYTEPGRPVVWVSNSIPGPGLSPAQSRICKLLPVSQSNT